jgi:hypothetical protein
MNSLELVDSFSEFKELKNIDKQTMQRVLEDVFRAMLKKKFNSDEHIDIVVNIDKGDVQIFLNKEIVDDGEVEDPNTEIAYSDAIKIEPDFEIGEEVTEEFKFGDFGRRNVLSLRQNLISRIMELERSLQEKFTKFGRKKSWYWTTKETSCCCQNQNKFLQIISKKEKRFVQLWRKWICVMQVQLLFCQEQHQNSWSVCSNWKFLKYSTV